MFPLNSSSKTKMQRFMTSVLLLAIPILSLTERFKCQDPDEFLNTTMLIQSKGYPAEEHDVTTSDGYILTIHRIPNPNKPVALLQHGLLDASSSFAINYPSQSLGFVLWDAGFDVWMGNMRGNTYGKRHVKLTPKDEAFWDFSWSDMAEHDLPSTIDYILELIKQESLFYIGHSQGTLIAFAQLGTNIRLQSQIKLFVGLGPVAIVPHIKSPIRFLADIGINNRQQIWYTLFGRRDFLPSSDTVKWLADKLCNHQIYDKLICENVLFALCGPSKHMNSSRVPVYETHSPAGTSVKNLAHFSQMIISGKFQMYDFGSKRANMARYNQSEPPLYDLSRVKTPVALYWASNDWLADPTDVDYLRQNLPNIVDDCNISDWNHLDFIWGINGKVMLYDRIIRLLQNYMKF